MWRGCCGRTFDSRLLLFFSQFAISIAILLFCLWQIAAAGDAQWAKMTITFIIGVWLPSPRVTD